MIWVRTQWEWDYNMPKHLHVSENDKRQLIHFIDGRNGTTVLANMPETMTIGVGSDIGSPFAGYASEGTAAKVLALTTGASNKVGVVTQRLFMGVDQPDINVDIKFEAYYSAYDEVLLPCIKLMLMATAEKHSLEDAVRKAIKFIEAGDSIYAETIAKIKQSERLDTDNFINYLRSPATCKVMFGDIFTIQKCFLANVSVSYSNVLDNDFVPMEATVSITLTPQDPFTKNSVVTMFKNRLQQRTQP